MGKHSGGEPVDSPSTRHLLILVAGLVATAAAWGALVWLAIRFGGEARAGQGIAWFFMVLAGLGAAACLFVTLILATRALTALGLLGRPAPAERPTAGRRAAR